MAYFQGIMLQLPMMLNKWFKTKHRAVTVKSSETQRKILNWIEPPQGQTKQLAYPS